MAIAVQTFNTATNGNGAAVVTKPTGTVSGDLLVAHVSQTGTSPITTVAGWTSIYATNGGTSSSLGINVMYKIAGGAEPATYTFGDANAGDSTIASVTRINGHDPNNPFTIATNNSGSSTSVTAPTLTPVQANSLILFFITSTPTAATASGFALTTSSPTFTKEYDLNFTGSGFLVNSTLAYGVRTAITATGTATATLSSSDSYISVLACFTPPGPNVSFTAPLLGVSTSLFTAFNTFIAPLLTINTNLLAAIVSKWSTFKKNISSWVTTTKN